MDSKDDVLALENLRFTWPRQERACLDIAQFSVGKGEAVFLHGPSGCGKSTLLSLLAGVLLPQAGRIALLGTDWSALRQTARDRYRVDHVGYIFQQFNLLPYLSALDNVLLPCRFSAQRDAAARALIGQPALIIADEPTSALDEDRRDAFLDLLLSACASARSALVLVSHDRRIAQRFGRQVLLPSINRAARPHEAVAA
jgi:putative ABC transport system ATP-binding protein